MFVGSKLFVGSKVRCVLNCGWTWALHGCMKSQQIPVLGNLIKVVLKWICLPSYISSFRLFSKMFLHLENSDLINNFLSLSCFQLYFAYLGISEDWSPCLQLLAGCDRARRTVWRESAAAQVCTAVAGLLKATRVFGLIFGMASPSSNLLHKILLHVYVALELLKKS